MSDVKSELKNPKQPKVALVCDWLMGTGGAERVVYQLHRQFPDAPIYTSQYNKNPGVWFGHNWFEDADVRTTWLQFLPLKLKKFYPLLRMLAFSRLDLSEYDIVISSSGAEAKFIKVKDDAIHVSYCHAPTHYYWSRYDSYLKDPGFGLLDPLARIALRFLVGPLRKLDYRAAQRPNYFIANSRHTQKDIKKYYGRDSTVIYPPVDVSRFSGVNKTTAERHSYLAAGRQTPYKKIDLAVEAATMLDVPLIVIGRGPQHNKLKRLAGRSVTLLTRVSDNEIPERFGEAKAFIFPGVDDFGIVAVEAMAAGTPIIAFGAGGALDFVDSTTGVLFKDQTPESLVEAIKAFEHRSFDHQRIAEKAKKFSSSTFRANISEYVKRLTSRNN
jgi:glycosyltransferase involved in cell wall biosynthesis